MCTVLPKMELPWRLCLTFRPALFTRQCFSSGPGRELNERERLTRVHEAACGDLSLIKQGCHDKVLTDAEQTTTNQDLMILHALLQTL